MTAGVFLALVLLDAGVAYACDCSDPTVLEAKQRAVVVFRGTITALRPTKRGPEPGDTGKMAVFRVSRVWKGDIGQTFEMRAIEEAGGCWGFAPQFLKLGAELIVYARRLAGMEYETNICSRTQFVKYAANDFAELGPGEEPKPSAPLRNSKSK